RRPWRRERSVDDIPEPPAASATQKGLDDLVVTRQTLLEGLRQVPPRQRAVLVLRYFEGLDVAATAAAIKCSEGNVKSQTARGLAEQRTALCAVVSAH